MSERNLKQTIISLLEKSHLLSVGDMLEKLAGEGKSYNKTSVYRVVEQLESENLVCRHHFTNDEAVFELSDHEHIHLVCNQCGKVVSSKTNIPPVLVQDDFIVEHQHTTLIGKCRQCKQKKTDIV